MDSLVKNGNFSVKICVVRTLKFNIGGPIWTEIPILEENFQW